MGSTEPGDHYLQGLEPQVGHTGEVTARVGQASKSVETENGRGSPTVLLSALTSPVTRGLCSKLQTGGPMGRAF